jgi:hypothetical protein
MIMPIEKHSLEFGKKEKVLNYACQTYQLSRPNKIGAVICNPLGLHRSVEKIMLSQTLHSVGMHPILN